jgi:hypothetical protein
MSEECQSCGECLMCGGDTLIYLHGLGLAPCLGCSSTKNLHDLIDALGGRKVEAQIIWEREEIKKHNQRMATG